MMSWKDRRTLKYAREILRGSQKWLRINRDLVSPAQASAITAAMSELHQALEARSAKAAAAQADKVEQKIGGALPAPPHPGLRENVEMLLVVGILVMGIRTFFIQPFKIPTGSMQPTLYGVYPPPEAPSLPYHNGEAPSIPARVAGIIFQGRIYDMFGYRSRGDHIFVDRFSYHFRKPQRGEVIVFDTRSVTGLPPESRGKFYIKRLIGLPGDRIRIQPPYVLVNDKVLDERKAFQRIYSLQNDYHGYVFALPSYQYPRPYIQDALDVFQVPEHNLFVLGDNSRSSLDCRYWGSFPGTDLVGRAMFVYWPFTRRFGLVD